MLITTSACSSLWTVARTVPAGASSSNSTSSALSQVRVMVTGLSGWVRGMVVSTVAISAQAMPAIIRAASVKQISFFIIRTPPRQR